MTRLVLPAAMLLTALAAWLSQATLAVATSDGPRIALLPLSAGSLTIAGLAYAVVEGYGGEVFGTGTGTGGTGEGGQSDNGGNAGAAPFLHPRGAFDVRRVGRGAEDGADRRRGLRDVHLVLLPSGGRPMRPLHRRRQAAKTRLFRVLKRR